jgi:drug/metabolite transporter (DMT)-like permease
VLVFGERPSPAGWLGIAMIGCGAVLIAAKV